MCYTRLWGPDDPTFSQGICSKSTNIRIISGMASEGWVSFSCIDTCHDRAVFLVLAEQGGMMYHPEKSFMI